ncbi:MAG TPA: carboxypeptidase-like regulatory domain-containing protein, partial [Armatimonadota bacterium]
CARGFAPVMQVVPADAPSTPIKITLTTPGHRLEGKVVDDTGKPVVGVNIFLRFDPTPGVLPPEAVSCSSLLPHTSSAKNGHFLLTDLPADHIQLQASAEGYASSSQMLPMDVPQTITIRRLSKISGRIVRLRNGKPVTKFAISVVQGYSGGSGGMRNSPDGSFVEYEYNGSHATGPVSAIIKAPGCLETRVNNVHYAPDGKPLIIRMPDARKLTGRITEQGTGIPLKGVLVSSGDDMSSVMAFVDHFDIGIPPATTRTDAAGRFTLEARTPKVTVILQKPGYGRMLMQRVDITAPFHAMLAKGAKITGKALADDGTPLKDCWVRIASLPDRIDYYDQRAKADGSYAVADLPGGAYVVSEGDDRETTVQVAAGQTVAVDWHRATGTSLHGTVIVSHGPVAGLSVTVAATDGSAEYKTTTDAQGLYSLTLLKPMSYFCVIQKDGGHFVAIHYLAIHAGENQYDVSNRCALSGQLVDAESGKPLAKVPLQGSVRTTMRDLVGQSTLFDQHLAPKWCPIASTTTDEQGRFTMSDLLTGEWLVTTEGRVVNGVQESASDIVVVPPVMLRDAEQKTDVVARMPRTGMAKITPVDAETGKPVTGVPVVCVDKWGHQIRSDSTPGPWNPATQRSSVFSRLPEGEYTVYTDSLNVFRPLPSNYRVSSAAITITAGNTTEAQLPLTRGGRVHFLRKGPVKGSDSMMILQYTISKPGSEGPVLSDAGGFYAGGGLVLSQGTQSSYLTLPPGTYHLELRVTTPRLSFSTALPALSGPPIISRDVTIEVGKDLELTLPE